MQYLHLNDDIIQICLQSGKVHTYLYSYFSYRFLFFFRKLFSVLMYFMFFFHVIIGFLTCIRRILLGGAIGILTLARIDRSLLPRGFEQLDSGTYPQQKTIQGQVTIIFQLPIIFIRIYRCLVVTNECCCMLFFC